MGSYFSSPHTDKISEEGGNGRLAYAASGMQGWRADMEDTHLAVLHIEVPAPPPVPGSAPAPTPPPANNAVPNAASGRGGGLLGGLFGRRPLERKAKEGQGEGGREGQDSGTAAEIDPQGEDLHAAAAEEGERERGNAGRGAQGDAGSVEVIFQKEEVKEKQGGGGGGGDGDGEEEKDLLRDAAVFAVFDGHGGKAVAEFCRDNLIGQILDCCPLRRGDWRKGFPALFHALDQALLPPGRGRVGTPTAGLDWGGAAGLGVASGCTAVMALVDMLRGECYVAHAGDSRAVLSRGGRVVQLTRDHKPHLPEERGRIQAAGGHVSATGRVNNNLNLSRSIGDLAYKRNHLCTPMDQIISAEPDVCRFDLMPGEDEFLVLACDGVWEMKTANQVVWFVRAGIHAGHPLKRVCEMLLDACLSPEPRTTSYAGCDNMTVLLIGLGEGAGARAGAGTCAYAYAACTGSRGAGAGTGTGSKVGTWDKVQANEKKGGHDEQKQRQEEEKEEEEEDRERVCFSRRRDVRRGATKRPGGEGVTKRKEAGVGEGGGAGAGDEGRKIRPQSADPLGNNTSNNSASTSSPHSNPIPNGHPQPGVQRAHPHQHQESPTWAIPMTSPNMTTKNSVRSRDSCSKTTLTTTSTLATGADRPGAGAGKGMFEFSVAKFSAPPARPSSYLSSATRRQITLARAARIQKHRRTSTGPGLSMPGSWAMDAKEASVGSGGGAGAGAGADFYVRKRADSDPPMGIGQEDGRGSGTPLHNIVVPAVVFRGKEEGGGAVEGGATLATGRHGHNPTSGPCPNPNLGPPNDRGHGCPGGRHGGEGIVDAAGFGGSPREGQSLPSMAQRVPSLTLEPSPPAMLVPQHILAGGAPMKLSPTKSGSRPEVVVEGLRSSTASSGAVGVDAGLEIRMAELPISPVVEVKVNNTKVRASPAARGAGFWQALP